MKTCKVIRSSSRLRLSMGRVGANILLAKSKDGHCDYLFGADTEYRNLNCELLLGYASNAGLNLTYPDIVKILEGLRLQDYSGTFEYLLSLLLRWSNCMEYRNLNCELLLGYASNAGLNLTYPDIVKILEGLRLQDYSGTFEYLLSLLLRWSICMDSTFSNTSDCGSCLLLY